MLSGGLDSAVLAAEEARTYVVHPVYVAGGLAWEEGEQRVIRAAAEPPAVHRRAAPACSPSRASNSACATCTRTSHWALTGTPPAYDTPDEDVYLHGRNIALLSKAAVYAATPQDLAHRRRAAGRQSVSRRHAAVLRGAERGVLARAGRADRNRRAVRAAAQGRCGEDRRAAWACPFELTLSCMNPSGTTHCGLCSKCRERRDAFRGRGDSGSDDLRQRQPR